MNNVHPGIWAVVGVLAIIALVVWLIPHIH